VRMVTTDSYRLSIKETELATTSFEGSREAIIPARAMQEVSRIFSGSDEESVEVALSENQALFRIGDVVFGTRLIDGNFPEYRRLLPSGFEREISVSREDLISTLRRVNLFAARQTPPVPVSLSFSEGSVEVIVHNGEVGDAHERLDLDLLQPELPPRRRLGDRFGEGRLQAQRAPQAGTHSARGERER
jgi:DNA polymerase III subunit beta